MLAIGELPKGKKGLLNRHEAVMRECEEASGERKARVGASVGGLVTGKTCATVECFEAKSPSISRRMSPFKRLSRTSIAGNNTWLEFLAYICASSVELPLVSSSMPETTVTRGTLNESND